MVDAGQSRAEPCTLAAHDLLRGLESAVDHVFATMLSTLGVHAREGEVSRLDTPLAEDGAPAITVEVRVDIHGPLQGWISLSCTAQAADDIARGMLLVGADDPLAEEEVEDALKECANLVAGLLKSALLDARGSHTIGIPSLAARKAECERPHGTLAYRRCAGTFDAQLWLDRRPETT